MTFLRNDRNPIARFEDQFERLGFTDQDVTIKESRDPQGIVLCDTQSCGLYDTLLAYSIITRLEEGDPVWEALDPACLEIDVADTWDA
jgi:hypothetical protein